MKTIIRKAYWNYEKEEKWLNEMSAKGFALTDYSWCRYVFADCQAGEYIYRIELLENPSTHPESVRYISFMEDNGIEHIASYMRWVYFRKKAADGEFNIYSDIDSRIKHYQRVNLLWLVLACSEICVGLSNILIGIAGMNMSSIFPINLTLGGIVTLIGFAFLAVSHPIRKKIKNLQTEKNLRE